MGALFISALTILLLAAAWQDCKNYRISNVLVFPGALLGIVLNSFLPEGIGLIDSLAGWCVGLLLLLPLYLLRMMGAGDVKLMAMVGAFLGPLATLIAFLYVLLTGGVLSICVACYRGVLRKMLLGVQVILYEFAMKLFSPIAKRTDPSTSSLDEKMLGSGKLPFGVAIAVGTVVFLITNTILPHHL